MKVRARIIGVDRLGKRICVHQGTLRIGARLLLGILGILGILGVPGVCLVLLSTAGYAQEQGQPGGPVPVPATRSNTPAAVEHRRWSGVVEPGEKVPELTDKDKWLFPLHETLRPVALFPAVVSGGYGILKNSDPKYGTNSEGFGERTGAAFLRQGSTRFFSDAMLPVIFHEDPRYFRKAYGSYPGRGRYAIERVFIDQHDSGKRGINFSDILGRGMSAALTQTYYPESSISPGVVLRTWGVSLAGDAGINLLQEFWPDIQRKILPHSRLFR